MSRKPRRYEDDDGRTIVDMSDVERPNLFLPRIPSQEAKSREAERRQRETDPSDRQRETLDLSPSERRWAILGMLKAALLIATPFAIGLGGIILLMDLFL